MSWRARAAFALAALLAACGDGGGASTATPEGSGGGIAGTALASTASPHTTHGGATATATAGATATPPGYAAVVVPEGARATLGIRTVVVERTRLVKRIRTVGLVVADETLTSHVHVKFEGFIERVHADFVGRAVKKGEPLFTIFSPDLLAAQQEYLVSRAALARAGTGALGESSRSAAKSLADASRRRLELFDVPPAVLAEIDRSGKPVRAVTITAPRSGTILERSALPGMAVDPMAHLYVIADLTRVWVLVDIYERDMPAVSMRAPASISLAGLPGAIYRGEVTFLSPKLDEVTRTLKVRIELENAYAALKPGMFATVELEKDLGEGLTIPSDAVIDTGVRKIVFVASGEGRYEPRALTLGVPLDDSYEVRGGLAAGEVIVTEGQFLLDSESRLRGSATGAAPSGHSGM